MFHGLVSAKNRKDSRANSQTSASIIAWILSLILLSLTMNKTAIIELLKENLEGRCQGAGWRLTRAQYRNFLK